MMMMIIIIINAQEGACYDQGTCINERVLQFILFTHYYYSDKIQKARLGRAYSTRKRI